MLQNLNLKIKSLVSMTCTRSMHSEKLNKTVKHVLFFKTKALKQTKINFYSFWPVPTRRNFQKNSWPDPTLGSTLPGTSLIPATKPTVSCRKTTGGVRALIPLVTVHIRAHYHSLEFRKCANRNRTNAAFYSRSTQSTYYDGNELKWCLQPNKKHRNALFWLRDAPRPHPSPLWNTWLHLYKQR